MSDKILSDILSQVQDSNNNIKELDKKFELHKQKMQYEIAKINELDDHQNKLIDEHIQGVNTLKDMHVAHRKESFQLIAKVKETCDAQINTANKRLDVLEKPSPWKIWLKQNKLIAGSVIAVLAGLATVLKFWEYLARFLGE